MVKIKHKGFKKIEWVTYDHYYHNIKDNDLYEVLMFKDIYELYNRISGTELWQATLEKKDAVDARKKHPHIFRIEYSDKNTNIEPKPITKQNLPYEITGAQSVLLDSLKLREAGLLDTNIHKSEPTIKQNTPPNIKTKPGTSVVKMFKWTVKKTSFIIMWVIIGILGTVIGGLLLLCSINYLKNKGFHI
ncbi:MAG: hypothetical protein M3O71_14570 [Bacteroidota bacterium]|nr:hypothetical protein [Bacteroidota bacterium]